MSQALENLLTEDRKFEPSPEFAAKAKAKPGIHEDAAAGLSRLLASPGPTADHLAQGAHQVLDDSNPPFFKWFADGELNISFNCLDRHLEEHGDQVAYHWVGEPGDKRTLTYQDLHSEVCRFANGLLSLGVQKGDRVAIYMGMVPELPIAMLACARLGLVHSVVFGGFSSDALSSRIIDADARVVITQDGAWRAGNVVPLKANADVALASTPDVEHVVVLKRTDHGVDMTEGRDIWWHDLVEGQSDECEPVVLNAEDPLYILYTSGTTGKPEGDRPHPGRLSDRDRHHPPLRLRSQARHRRLLVRRRHRLGHRSQLHRLRPARQPGDQRHVRGRPQLPGPRPSVADHRGLQGHHLLHRPNRDPHLHEMGRRAREQARSDLPAADRDCWRADQPRGLDLVPAR